MREFIKASCLIILVKFENDLKWRQIPFYNPKLGEPNNNSIMMYS